MTQHEQIIQPPDAEQLLQVHNLHRSELALDPAQEIYDAAELGIVQEMKDYRVGVMAEVRIPTEKGKDVVAAILSVTRKADGAQKFIMQGLAKDQDGKMVSNGRQHVEITEKGIVFGRNGDDDAKRSDEVPSSLLWPPKSYGSATSRRHASVHIEERDNGPEVIISDNSSNGTEVVTPVHETKAVSAEAVRAVGGVRELAGEVAVGSAVQATAETQEAAHNDIDAAERSVAQLVESGREGFAGMLFSELVRNGDIDEVKIGRALRDMSARMNEMTGGGKQFAGFEDIADRMHEIVQKESKAQRYSGQIRGTNAYAVRDLVADAVQVAGAHLEKHRQWHEEKGNSSSANVDATTIQSVFYDGMKFAMRDVSTMNGAPVSEYINSKLSG